MSVVITVRGSFSAFRPPERATAHVSLALEASTSEVAYAEAAQSASVISSSLTELHNPDGGPVTWWSSDQIRTWAHRPWNNEGKQLPLVHRASVTFAAKFSDFDRLSAWIARTAAIKGATVKRIEWALTAAHRDQLTREVRASAVRDARDKAQSYADALSLGPAQVVALADAGMLDQGLNPTGNVAAAVFADGGRRPGESPGRICAGRRRDFGDHRREVRRRRPAVM